MKRIVLLSLILFGIMLTSAMAKEIYVSADTDIGMGRGVGVIEAVVKDPTTVDYDVIVLGPGIYKGCGAIDGWHAPIDPQGKKLVFRSMMGSASAEYTIIYGGSRSMGLNAPYYDYYLRPAVYFHHNEDRDCKLIGLTIKSGFLLSEGAPQDINEKWSCGCCGDDYTCAGLVCDGAGPTIIGCKFEGGDESLTGHFYDAPAIKCKNSNALIQNCTISIAHLSQSTADPDSDAGIAIRDNNDMTIIGSTISVNLGQAVHTSGTGNITITNCTIDNGGNFAKGLRLENSGNINITGTGEIIVGIPEDPFIPPSTTTITNCSNNGILVGNVGANVKIDGCTLTKNITNEAGGAIYLYSCASATISNCTITGNKAPGGGGIYLHSNAHNVGIINCIISDNEASGSGAAGGGIYISTGGTTPTVTHCEIKGNKALNPSNTVYGACGGGIMSERNIDIINCMIENNVADTEHKGEGGGIYLDGTTSNIKDCTIAGNQAHKNGGARLSHPTQMYNSIFWGNRGNSGDGFDTRQILNAGPDSSYIKFCDIEHSGPITCGKKYIVDESSPFNYYAGLDGGNNFNQNPCFISTLDHHLKGCSPCIDVGNTALLPSDTFDLDKDGNTTEKIPFDIDGGPRINGGLDIGADEVAGKRIMTCDDLQAMRDNLSGDYYLPYDVYCSCAVDWNNGAGFEPIGTSWPSSFRGTFDGGGFKIKDLHINRPDTEFVGLFGCISGAQISNVGLENVAIIGGGNVGALVGASSNGTITNSYSTGKVSGIGRQVGGLLGVHYDRTGTITNSYSTADVKSSSNGVGGLVGANYDAKITNSYSTGSVSGIGSQVGGLLGLNYDYRFGTITNSYYDTSTSGQSDTGKGEPRTTAEMTYPHAGDTYMGWEFGPTWEEDTININGGYPYLEIFVGGQAAAGGEAASQQIETSSVPSNTTISGTTTETETAVESTPAEESYTITESTPLTSVSNAQIVEPVSNSSPEIVQTEQNIATEPKMIASLPSSIAENSREDILANPELKYNPDVATAVEGGAKMGESILVHRLDTGNNYYLVPFNKPSKTDSEKVLTFVVVMLDANDGKFIQASSNDKPIEYLTIGKQDAINLVVKSEKEVSNTGNINAELVWKPELSTSPFYPVWKITTGKEVWFVSQDGIITKE